MNELSDIFLKNRDKRICVLGTTCTGKSTIINELGIGEDMDEVIFPLLTPQEEAYVCQDVWCEEIGKFMDELVRSKLKIKPCKPLFGTVLLDCDLIVYLDISDELLKERCRLRGVNFSNALGMKKKIEEEISLSSIPCIKVLVSDIRKCDKYVKTI